MVIEAFRIELFDRCGGRGSVFRRRVSLIRRIKKPYLNVHSSLIIAVSTGLDCAGLDTRSFANVVGRGYCSSHRWKMTLFSILPPNIIPSDVDLIS
jgi:hypothetical protein